MKPNVFLSILAGIVISAIIMLFLKFSIGHLSNYKLLLPFVIVSILLSTEFFKFWSVSYKIKQNGKQ